MAQVFLGVATGPESCGTPVVIKRLRPHLAADADSVRRFKNEACIHSQVRHPNVVAMQASGDDADGPFIALDWVDGASLQELVQRSRRLSRPMPMRVVSRILVDALHGLHAAHVARDRAGRLLGLLHRDATPHNILVGRDGVARLSDFGVAKQRGGPNITNSHMVVGKTLYMASEYLAHRPTDVRMDVYSMGMTAWVSLASRPPFPKVRRPTECPERRVADLDSFPGIPSEIGHVIDRACRQDAADRFPTAMEMAIALEEAVHCSDVLATHDQVGEVVTDLLCAPEPASARRPPPPEAPKPWDRLGVCEAVWREEAPTSPYVSSAGRYGPGIPEDGVSTESADGSG